MAVAAEQGRVVLFECVTGSHLYGTHLPTSDWDFAGVFAPSPVDHFGLQACPTEWVKNEKVSPGLRNGPGDVDLKYFSVRRFCQLAGEGQSGPLEMLFAPSRLVRVSSGLWSTVAANRDAFLSRKGVAPFVGFAMAQARKTSVRGEDLRRVRALRDALGDAASSKVGRLVDFIETGRHPLPDVPGPAILAGQAVTLVAGEGRHPMMVEVAGRRWYVTVSPGVMLDGLDKLLAGYGSRTEAAAEDRYDRKGLLHAFRLLGEAEEFLRDGRITLPRPTAELDFLMRIRRREWPGPNDDPFRELFERLDVLKREVEPRSPLPEEADWDRIQRVCVEVQAESIGLEWPAERTSETA